MLVAPHIVYVGACSCSHNRYSGLLLLTYLKPFLDSSENFFVSRLDDEIVPPFPFEDLQLTLGDVRSGLVYKTNATLK